MGYTDINQCIQFLNERPMWFFQKDDIAEKMKCFDTVQEMGTASTIYFLIRYLKTDNSIIKDKCAETILHLFAKLKSQNEFADSLKNLGIEESDLDLFRVSFDDKTYIQLLGIASLNRNGYVREKAVREIARLKNTDGIKFILFRLADWVLPVRLTAVEAINSYLDPANIEQLLKELSTVDWLLSVRRVNLKEIHSRIIQFILNQQLTEEFYKRIKLLDEKNRHRYFKYYFEQNKPGKELLRSIAKDKSFLIRLEVLNNLSGYDTDFQEELIADFLHDQSARIKLKALYASTAYSPKFDNEIEILLSDESASVRSLCRYLLKSKSFVFADIYRERIRRGSFFSGSLIGLSEVGTIHDLLIFEEYINSESSKVVISSLAAINRFNPDKARGYALGLLTHRTNRVRTKAGEMVSKNCDSDTMHKLRQTYLIGNHETKKSVLKIYNSMGGWNVVGDFLISLTEDNIEIQNMGWQFIEKWRMKSTRLFTTPSKDELERANEIYRNLDQRKIKLTTSRTNLLQDLQFFLR